MIVNIEDNKNIYKYIVYIQYVSLKVTVKPSQGVGYRWRVLYSHIFPRLLLYNLCKVA